VAIKNSSKSFLIGNVLNKEAYYYGSSAISKGGYTDSELLRAEQGKSFISPQELTNILQGNTPAGSPYPPLPPTPPPGPFPSKAFFSPISRPSANITYLFNSPSSTNILAATDYSIAFAYPYPIYASSYGFSVTSNITNYTQATDYQNIYVNVPIISLSNTANYNITLYGSNNYGSSKVSISNLSETDTRPPATADYSGLTSSNGVTEIIYTFLHIAHTKYYLFKTYDSVGASYPASKDSYLSNGVINLRVYGLNMGETYTTLITASNSFGTSQITLQSTTLPPEYVGRDILYYARYLNYSLTGNILPKHVENNLTINGENQYSFDYSKRMGDVNFNITPFNPNTFFTITPDTTSSWVIIDGNLIIDPLTTFTPPVRKLFTVLYVTGDLLNNGTISMSARGANHSNLVANNIYIGDINRSNSLSNIFIGSGGGFGGAGYRYTYSDNVTRIVGESGKNGFGGGTGGGSTGIFYIRNGTFRTGSGARGTSYSGGAGSGGLYALSSDPTTTGATCNASTNGGPGTYGVSLTTTRLGGGGAGNPSGSNSDGSGIVESGTGGTLIVIVEGVISGNGVFTSRGVDGNRVSTDGRGSGGGSGGGSISVLYGTLATTLNFDVFGGSTGGFYKAGNGSFRSFAIGSN
jgi:hypothetical protein